MKEKQMTKQETLFGQKVIGWLGGESFLKSNLQIKNIFIESNAEDQSMKVDLRWQKRQNKGINGMVLIKEHEKIKLLFTNYGQHSKSKRYTSKIVKSYTDVLERQIPTLFEETTGYNISVFKS